MNQLLIFLQNQVKFFLAFGLILFSLEGNAQETNLDVVYKRDGTIIKGTIIEIIPKREVKIKTQNGELVNVDLNEVKNIGKVEGVDKRKSKYQMMLDFGYNIGVGTLKSSTGNTKNKDAIYSFNIIQSGFNIKQKYSIGLGFGLDVFKETTQLPVFLDFRQQILKSRLKVALVADCGYNFGLEKEEDAYLTVKDKGGIMFNTNIGFEFDFSKTSAVYCTVGYKFLEDKITGTDRRGTPVFNENKRGGFLVLRLGFAFG
ncbi:MAG: hypothetical protein IPJ79_20675 [Bacteroidetes bacterium]|nr:hypothetical protein [Bacteroidota bacterium]